MASSDDRYGTAKMAQGPRRNAGDPASNTCSEQNRPLDSELLSTVVAACQHGEPAAYQQLYESFHQDVYRLAVRMVGLQDAADVTQQAFLQVFRSIQQFNGRSRFETWLYRVAVNESLGHLRRKKRWRHHSLDWEPGEEPPDRERAERKELLEQSLERIDPVLRSIFLLREVEGLSYRDIAEATSIPEGTVGSRLNRARRELRKHLSDLGFELK